MMALVAIFGSSVFWSQESDWEIMFFFLPVFLVGGMIAWKIYKGDQWWKLLGYSYVATTSVLVCLFFLLDYLDDGVTILDMEAILVVLLLWSVFTILPMCIASFGIKVILDRKK
ncbi:hypothetical protein [Prevotella dentasini]|uniref:hypothetical protein n=1 Tax=Prevotella dentasini TaxID=589537 RepID=UPI000A705B43|nr:hypothetical protein [Prevotella dentasini]